MRNAAGRAAGRAGAPGIAMEPEIGVGRKRLRRKKRK